VTGNAGNHLADVMGEIARILDQPHTVDEQLALVVEAAADSIDGVDACSITVLHRDGRVETLVGTDPLAYRLDKAQYDLNEGPCLGALQGEPFQRVDDMPQERRWPRYAQAAVAEGVRSQMAVELYADERSIGGLNLYSRHDRAFDEDTRHTAWLFATHAALAMGRTRQSQELNEALTTRKVIGQAIGIVMHRFELTEERAFEFLVRVSRTSNTKLRDVARQINDEQNRKVTAKGQPSLH
jgi:GAF domain-containing protein